MIETKKPLHSEYSQFQLVYDETKALYNSGKYKTVHQAMQEELGSVCYRILENTAVFKEEKDLLAFLATVGFEK